MAKKLNTENTNNSEANDNATDIDAVKEAKTEGTEDAIKDTEIPSMAKKLLEQCPSYESLYISAKGEVFVPNTPVHVRGVAVLYKNPFYNN